jgi:Fe-S cluster assembly protein SufB
MADTLKNINEDYAEKYGFKTNVKYEDMLKGINKENVIMISKLKQEPEWMLEKRLLGFNIFTSKTNPRWGTGSLEDINYDDIYAYLKPNAKEAYNWEDVPKDIRDTFEKLGVPEKERKFFAGGEAQFDSSAVYSSIKKELEKLGVIFTDTDTAVKKYPDIVKKYFGTIIPPSDNKFAALNTAVWSGGSFIYVPKGVKVPLPLQAYFRINSEKAGQFERTLIIADEGSEVTYLEGCTAPIYSSTSLHSAVVEIYVAKDAHVRYITIQNWSKNVYNLVTQRAHVYENGHMEWVGFDIGSKLNMKYPSVFLKEPRAKGDILSVAVASTNQIQDSGGKAYHLAPNTVSKIISKSISIGNGETTYRGLVHIAKDAVNSVSATQCDAMMVDDTSKTNTYPYTDIKNESSTLSHEASVGRISQDQLHYLESRGIKEEDAKALILLGFIQPLTEVIPLEYSIELSRLLRIELQNAVG